MKMLNNFLMVIIFFLFGGCATLDTVRTKNRENLVRLQIGMTKTEVLEIMGTNTIQTWPHPTTWWTCLAFIPPTPTGKINNPYRSETVRVGNEMWEILTFYTESKRKETFLRVVSMTDDETTPLVFQNNKLIGWGWRFLEDVEAKYEIRIR